MSITGPVTWQRARAVLYAGALAVFLGASTVASPEPPATSASSKEPTDQAAESPEAKIIDPFTQEEVTFRYFPGWTELLGGTDGEATATVLIGLDCKITTVEDNSIVLVPHAPTGGGQALRPTELELDPALPEGAVLPLCPVELEATMSVADPSGGWLLWDDAGLAAGLVADPVTVPYSVRRIIHWSGYALLAATAAVVAVFGALRGATAYATKRQAQQTTAGAQQRTPQAQQAVDEKAGALPTLPVMASILGAITAATTGALVWTDLVPGMDLGGIVVIGLIGGVCVAAGDRLSLTYSDGRSRAWFGLFLSLFGTVTIAMLLPFVLLHGATMGVASGLAWLFVAFLLGLASRVGLPQTD